VKEYDQYLPIVSKPNIPEEQKKMLRRKLNDLINVGLLAAREWERLRAILDGTPLYGEQHE
jgi:hypothetical protein